MGGADFGAEVRAKVEQALNSALNAAGVSGQVQYVYSAGQAPSVVSAAPADGETIARALNEQLQAAGLNGISAQIDTAGKVRLQGTVSSQEQHDRAVQITSSQAGVAGVVDLLQIAASQPAAQNRDPARLEGEINRLLRNNGLGGVTAQVADDFLRDTQGIRHQFPETESVLSSTSVSFPSRELRGTKCSLLSRFFMRKWSMNASFVYRLALAFVLVPLGGCADPNIRDRWVRDYRVPPERAPTPVAPVRPTDRPADTVRPEPKPGDGARGTSLEVGRSTISPRNVSPGGSLVVSVPYTVLTTNAGATVKITETHTLVIDNEPVELRRQEVVRRQGTHTATAKVTLPSTLAAGNYTLVATISDGKINKSEKASFAVK